MKKTQQHIQMLNTHQVQTVDACVASFFGHLFLNIFVLFLNGITFLAIHQNSQQFNDSYGEADIHLNVQKLKKKHKII